MTLRLDREAPAVPHDWRHRAPARQFLGWMPSPSSTSSSASVAWRAGMPTSGRSLNSNTCMRPYRPDESCGSASQAQPAGRITCIWSRPTRLAFERSSPFATTCAHIRAWPKNMRLSSTNLRPNLNMTATHTREQRPISSLTFSRKRSRRTSAPSDRSIKPGLPRRPGPVRSHEARPGGRGVRTGLRGLEPEGLDSGSHVVPRSPL